MEEGPSPPNRDIREVRVAAGSLCSSTRGELFARRALLEELLTKTGRDTSLPIIIVCTDSMAALALLRSGSAAQRAPLAADIWGLLAALTEGASQ